MSERRLIEEALLWATGERGPKCQANYEEDARYTYPKRLEGIIKLLEEFLHGTEKEPVSRQEAIRISNEILEKAERERLPSRRRKRSANRLGPKGSDRRGAGWNRIEAIPCCKRSN